MRYLFGLLIPILFLVAACQPANSPASDTSSLSGTDHREGFFDLHVDEETNKIYAKLPKADETGVMLRFIHAARLTAGLGSNPVGLDRGWGEGGRVVVIRQLGDKIILEQENLSYRASPENPLEERAVRESFARSFLATLPIKDKRADGIIVDLTDFLTADSLNLVQYLKDADQGSFSVAKDRTFVDIDNSFAFPDNVEIDVFFTLTSNDPGREVASTAANSNVATLIQHHSFVRLPEAGFEPLLSDPRSGAIEQVHYDYSAALSAPIETRYARRYRLEKDEDGNVIKPIIFYIDSGAPEPIRSALIDGARWWEEAFEAAGFPGGYKVEILPEDAHPLDIRYNTVQWVHRQTRGWSYGGGVSDPRTGEMLKGHVNLGSLRVRQDRMIFEGLAGVSKTDSGDPDDPVQLALARIRQLSAHEVGHALGFAHNFAASSDRKASVMDYPAPDVRVKDGKLDFSNSYGVGVGGWDLFTTDWLYGQHSKAERDALIRQAYGAGLTYVADREGRSVGTGHPDGSVWDNGLDAVATLSEVMQVRRIALDNFGPDNLMEGRPRSDLNAALVPIYLYHRFQTAAAAKSIGGMRFSYSVNGDDMPAAQIVEPSQQWAALDAVLATLDPKALDLKDETLDYLTPSLGTWSFADSDRELFRRTAYPAFDIIAAADTSAALTFEALLHPQRVTRLVEFNRRDGRNPSLEDVLVRIRRKVLSGPKLGRTAEIGQAIRARYAYALIDLIEADTSAAITARIDTELTLYAKALDASGTSGNQWLAREIERFQSRPANTDAAFIAAKQRPPGSPIGSTDR